MCDCGEFPDAVTDAASGDCVCRRCGVVVEAHMFDDRLEHWSDEGGGPRAGIVTDAWLLPHPPTTLGAATLRFVGTADPYHTVRELCGMVERMGRTLTTAVQDHAKQLLRDMHLARGIRSDARQVHVACALYLAAKMCGGGSGIARSKREMALQCGVAEKALTTTAKVFRDMLRSTEYSSQLGNGLNANDLIVRCVDKLDLPDAHAAKRLKRDALNLADDVPSIEVEGKTPAGVCSGIVALAASRLDLGLSKKHVAAACQVSSATVDKMTKLVHVLTFKADPIPRM